LLECRVFRGKNNAIMPIVTDLFVQVYPSPGMDVSY